LSTPQRKFDLVLFWPLDRLSREGVSATLNHLERLTAAGVEWRSFTEQYLDSCGLFRDAMLSYSWPRSPSKKRKLVGASLLAVQRLQAEGLSLRAIARIHVSTMTAQRALNRC